MRSMEYVDGVLDASVWCPLRIFVFEAEGRASRSSGILGGKACITGDVRSIARSSHVYHPIRSLLNDSKSAFVKAFVKEGSVVFIFV